VSDDLLWAYGVVASGTAPSASVLAGITGGAVVPLDAGGLTALVSAVPSAQFAAEPLREHLNDLDWLGRVAREHEAVLEQVLGATTVVPLRLCTIFDDAEGVERMLEREREPLTDALGRLEGRHEMGVKLLVDPARLASRPAPDGDQARGEGGAAYLARRRQERQAREEVRSVAAQLVDDVDGALRACAIDAVRLPSQNRELSGHAGEMLLNGAYLVDASGIDRLRALVGELQERHAAAGARLELTGPWPPYNFVSGERTAQPA
jgi:hypothetical protein